MRRGSVSTFDTVERRRSAGIVSLEHRNSTRQEFSVNDIEEESTGGCYISYRSIAFAFVFFLALIVGAAFIGVYIGTPPEKDFVDAYNVLGTEDVAKEKYVLASSIKPVRYRVKLEPIPGGGDKAPRVRIKGYANIEFVQNGTEAPTQIVLNSRGLGYKTLKLHTLKKTNSSEAGKPVNETKLALDNSTTDLTAVEKDPSLFTEIKISSNKTDASEGVYVIMLDKPLSNGSYFLDITYEATVNDNVINVENFTKNFENRLLMISKLKPANARRIFPTLDEVRQKATFELTLLIPHGTKALSNELLLTSKDRDENTTADTFVETKPMSAHDLAFVISSPKYIVEIVDPDPSQPGVVYWGEAERREHELYLKNKVDLILDEYAEMFENISRPTDKLDLVALPIDYDGLSSPGLIVTRETLFYVSADSAILLRTKALLSIIGLVGQQWLGGLVEARNWTDAWYLEGSVLYLPYVMLEKIEKNLKSPGDFLVDVQLDTMENDGYKIAKSLDALIDPNRIDAFDLEDIYKKGACLISMLHASLNESVFRNGYAEFLRSWSYRSADSEDFLRILGGNVTLEDGDRKTLDKAFRSWERLPGYPLINVTWNRDNGTVTVKQNKFNFDELSNENEAPKLDELWWVPITYATEHEDWTQPKVKWLKGKKEMILENVGKGSGNESWIFVNVNRRGYYRVNYDEVSWRALSTALAKSYSDIPPASRASLIDDALSLARQGSLEYELAFELLEYFGPHERDYAPWRALARHVEQLDFALYETTVYPKFREFMRKLVAPLFDELEQKINQGSPLVMLAVQLACTYEHQKCKSWAKSKWEQLLKSSSENMLLKHIRKPVYCYGAKHGGQEELSYLMKKFTETNDREEKNRLLSALGCFQAPWILRSVLTEILKEGSYEDADIKVILKAFSKNPAAAQEARRFVLENWKNILNRFDTSYWTMKSFVDVSTSLLFTEFDLNEFNTFRDENIETLKAKGHGKVIILNEMKAISWIYRLKESIGNIQRWFTNQTSVAAV